MKAEVAIVQDAPILFDLPRSLEKVAALAARAAKTNPDLVVFPEAFLPGYPRGLSFGTPVGSRSEKGKEEWLTYAQNSVPMSGNTLEVLGEIARRHAIYLVIGVVERAETGTLYCSLLYFDREGKLIGKHRKLKPTGAERVIWGEGDGSDLETYQTPFGKIGGLICWENYMPLARAHLYQCGVDIYLAPTADQRDSWQATLKHIACEGRCFVIGCNQFVTKDDYPGHLQAEIADFDDLMCKGGSVVIDPFGNEVVEPLWNESGILTATLDMDLVLKGKMDFDVVGHYDRPDVFRLEKLK